MAKDGDSGGGLSWAALLEVAPEWFGTLASYGERAATIVSNPRQVILGVLATTLVSGILDLFRPVLDAISLVLVGSNPVATTGLFGIADIPQLILEYLIAAGEPIGNVVLSLISGMGAWMAGVASSLGIFALPVGAAGIVAVFVVADRVVKPAAVTAIEAIPYVGPPLARLLGGL